MHKNASTTPESRELVAELEFVWDRIKSNYNSSALSSSSIPQDNSSALPLPRSQRQQQQQKQHRPRIQTNSIEAEPGRRVENNIGTGGELQNLSPTGLGHRQPVMRRQSIEFGDPIIISQNTPAPANGAGKSNKPS